MSLEFYIREKCCNGHYLRQCGLGNSYVNVMIPYKLSMYKHTRQYSPTVMHQDFVVAIKNLIFAWVCYYVFPFVNVWKKHHVSVLVVLCMLNFDSFALSPQTINNFHEIHIFCCQNVPNSCVINCKLNTFSNSPLFRRIELIISTVVVV